MCVLVNTQPTGCRDLTVRTGCCLGLYLHGWWSEIFLWRLNSSAVITWNKFTSVSRLFVDLSHFSVGVSDTNGLINSSDRHVRVSVSSWDPAAVCFRFTRTTWRPETFQLKIYLQHHKPNIYFPVVFMWFVLSGFNLSDLTEGCAPRCPLLVTVQQ